MMRGSEWLGIAGAPAVKDQGAAPCCPNNLVRYIAPHPSAAQRVVQEYKRRRLTGARPAPVSAQHMSVGAKGELPQCALDHLAKIGRRQRNKIALS